MGLILLVSITCKAQMLAVNSNLVLDASGSPSLGLELVVGNRTTLGVKGFRFMSPVIKSVRCTAIQPQYKYYLSGRAKHSHFIGIGGVLADYKLNHRRKRYEGQGAGIGAIFGYEWNLSKRLSLEFHGGVAPFFYKQKEYYSEDKYENYSEAGEKMNAHGMYVLPTDIGLTLSYVIK